MFLSIFYKKKHLIQEITPSISFIVAAYNEDKVIDRKIKNAALMEYPTDKLEIIFITDGSTDNTANIIKKYSGNKIRLLHKDMREGKTAALNRAISNARHDIIVFSDANSMFKSDALKKLVRHFADQSIGGVCGRKKILNHKGRASSRGDSLYWKYEAALKFAESNIGSISTADGEIFAIRKSLYNYIGPKIINDDMAITLNILSKNFRVIYEKDAIAEEEASVTINDDFNVKRRMVHGGIQILSLYKKELNPFFSFFALQFFFHKTLRYFMWPFLIMIFLINIFCLSYNLFYVIFFYLQLLFYTIAVFGHLANKSNISIKLTYFPYYYCCMNIAAMNGLFSYLKQKPLIDVWTKAKR